MSCGQERMPQTRPEATPMFGPYVTVQFCCFRLPVSPFEYWYAAGPAYDAGEFDHAIEILAEGLEEWPEHPRVHYNLACFHARAGHRDEAIHHLRFAAERDPVVLEFAAGDEDLDAIRDDPGFPRA